MKNDEMQQNFLHPTNRYGVAPFWFLNGDLDLDELSWQIREMKEKGLAGYVMHSRYGRRIPYFSEDFFARIGHIIRESQVHGMSAIIYDEDDWPSGMTGTKVLDDHPEYKHRQLSIAWQPCKGRKTADLELVEGDVVAAFAARFEVEHDLISQSRLKDITPIQPHLQGRRLVYPNEAKFDLVVVFVNEIVHGFNPKTTFPVKKGWDAQPNSWGWYFPYGNYVDLLDPQVVAYFLQTTAEEYKKRFGEHFGKAVTHMYTDEPGFYTIMRGNDTAVPWSNIFREHFRQDFGYDIVPYLPALVCDIGDKTTKVRHDFWAEITSLFENSFVKQYQDWCRRNNLKLTGHFRLCYPQLVWQRNYAGNVISLFRNMDAPGVDRLDTPGMVQPLGIKDWAWQIEDKLCSSVGHQYGITRRMTESFALGGWEYRFADMKRVTDWQYMMGMNMMVPHAFHYSLSGQRKRECIPSEFYQNPMWHHYKSYSEYISRLGEMMIDGIHIADIAVLYPMTTLWTDDVPKAEVDDLPNNVDRDFAYITDLLLRNQLDYDILGEDELNASTLDGTVLHIGQAGYSLLIVPPMFTLRKESAAALEKFINAGGKVIFLSVPPFKDIDGGALAGLVAMVQQEFGVEVDGLLEMYRRNQAKPSLHPAARLKGQLALVSAGVLKDNLPDELILKAIGDMHDRDLEIHFKGGQKGNIYYNHHKKEGRDIYFLCNSDEGSAHDIEVTLRCVGTPFFYHPDPGKIEKVYFYQQVEGKTVIPTRLDPLGSVFIVLEPQVEERVGKAAIESNLTVLSAAREGAQTRLDVILEAEPQTGGYIRHLLDGKITATRVDFQKDGQITLRDEWEKKLITPNVFILDHWLMIQDEAPEEDAPMASWDSAWGSVIKYVGEFDLREKCSQLKAVFDRIPEIRYDGVAQPVGIFMNGAPLTGFGKSDFLDHEFQEVDITDRVVIGKNTIEIIYNHSTLAFEGKTGIERVSMMWDPVYIIGDFALEKDSSTINGYAIVREPRTLKTGSWAKQGFPYLSGCMEYRQEVHVEPAFLDGRRCFLDAGCNIREYAEVFVNGSLVGSRIWPPFKLDVSGALQPGNNEIRIRVRNTPKNIFQKILMDSGITGEVKIISKEIGQVLV